MNQVEVKRRQIEGFSHLLGAAAILFLGRFMGENGLAYFAAAYEAFSFLWILVGQKTADALGRMLRSKNAKGQYKNRYRIKRYAMISQGILGLAAGVLLFLLGGVLVTYVFHMPKGASLTVIFAAVLLLRTVESVLLGYFQGMGSELPTAVTAVLRQALLIGTGFLLGSLFSSYGEKVSALLGPEKFTGMYGAIGVAAACAVTEVFLLLFLLIVYRGSGRGKEAEPQEGLRSIDSFGGMLRALYGTMAGEILSALLQRLPVWMGLALLGVTASELVDTEVAYGVFYGKYLVITGGILFLIDALTLQTAARVQAHLKRNDPKYARGIFQTGIHVSAVYGIFFSVFLASMGNYVAEIFCKTGVEMAGQMLSQGSFVILFAGISAYFYRLLWMWGKRPLVLTGLFSMNVVFLASAFLFSGVGKFGVHSYVYAGLVSGAVLCLFLGFWTLRELGTGIDWVQTLGLPAGCACVAGLVCLFVGKMLSPHLGAPVTVAVCLSASWILYWCALVLLRNFREQELKYVPAGGIVRALGQILRVYS